MDGGSVEKFTSPKLANTLDRVRLQAFDGNAQLMDHGYGKKQRVQ